MALGKGAAFGVDLYTKAQVKLTDEPAIVKAEIASDPKESTVLMEKTVARVLQPFQSGKEIRRQSQNLVQHPHRQRA